MAYRITLTRTADKAQRKLEKPLRKVLAEAVMGLARTPKMLGERLSQPLTMVFSHHVKYKGKEYRIAYQVLDDAEMVVVLLIGSHENFYRKLKNMVYAA